MALKSPLTSHLNPNAPLFIPYSYQMVEDFSSEWWKLVQSSPDFRDYWLRERQPVLEEHSFLPDELFSTADDELFEIDLDGDDICDDDIPVIKDKPLGWEEKNDTPKAADATAFDMKGLIARLKIPDVTGSKFSQKHQSALYFEKPPKAVADVSRRSTARRIQQPR